MTVGFIATIAGVLILGFLLIFLYGQTKKKMGEMITRLEDQGRDDEIHRRVQEILDTDPNSIDSRKRLRKLLDEKRGQDSSN